MALGVVAVWKRSVSTTRLAGTPFICRSSSSSSASGRRPETGGDAVIGVVALLRLFDLGAAFAATGGLLAPFGGSDRSFMIIFNKLGAAL